MFDDLDLLGCDFVWNFRFDNGFSEEHTVSIFGVKSLSFNTGSYRLDEKYCNVQTSHIENIGPKIIVSRSAVTK
jgi:hypothetical protein